MLSSGYDLMHLATRNSGPRTIFHAVDFDWSIIYCLREYRTACKSRSNFTARWAPKWKRNLEIRMKRNLSAVALPRKLGRIEARVNWSCSIDGHNLSNYEPSAPLIWCRPVNSRRTKFFGPSNPAELNKI